jgi:hypothetical protein
MRYAGTPIGEHRPSGDNPSHAVTRPVQWLFHAWRKPYRGYALQGEARNAERQANYQIDEAAASPGSENTAKH